MARAEPLVVRRPGLDVGARDHLAVVRVVAHAPVHGTGSDAQQSACVQIAGFRRTRRRLCSRTPCRPGAPRARRRRRRALSRSRPGCTSAERRSRRRSSPPRRTPRRSSRRSRRRPVVVADVVGEEPRIEAAAAGSAAAAAAAAVAAAAASWAGAAAAATAAAAAAATASAGSPRRSTPAANAIKRTPRTSTGLRRPGGVRTCCRRAAAPADSAAFGHRRAAAVNPVAAGTYRVFGFRPSRSLRELNVRSRRAADGGMPRLRLSLPHTHTDAHLAARAAGLSGPPAPACARVCGCACASAWRAFARRRRWAPRSRAPAPARGDRALGARRRVAVAHGVVDLVALCRCQWHVLWPYLLLALPRAPPPWTRCSSAPRRSSTLRATATCRPARSSTASCCTSPRRARRERPHARGHRPGPRLPRRRACRRSSPPSWRCTTARRCCPCSGRAARARGARDDRGGRWRRRVRPAHGGAPLRRPRAARRRRARGRRRLWLAHATRAADSDG